MIKGLYDTTVLAGDVVIENGLSRRHGFSTAQKLVRLIGWDDIVRAIFGEDMDEVFHLQGGPL